MSFSPGSEQSAALVIDGELVTRLESRFVGSFSRDATLDGIDWIAAGVAGSVAAAVDLLVVAIPRDITYLGEHQQKGSILTKLFQSWEVDSDNLLARKAKVPFDLVNGGARSVPRMYPGNHRLMTPGHDPLLGLVVGIHDLLRGGRTSIGVGDGKVRFDGGTGDPATSLAAAIVLEVVHLLSDVCTRAGLPAPLATAANLLQFGAFGTHGRTVAELAEFAYAKGYDLRHFVTTCSAPAASRLVIGAYLLGRQWIDDDYCAGYESVARRQRALLGHPRFETMCFMADALAVAANAGKIALYRGNPAAFNYGQWLAFLRSGCVLAANAVESPSEVLLDRARTNETALRRTWLETRDALGLADVPDPSDAF
jgi:hypothetical protein